MTWPAAAITLAVLCCYGLIWGLVQASKDADRAATGHPRPGTGQPSTPSEGWPDDLPPAA